MAKVRYLGVVRNLVNKKEEEIEAKNVRELLKKIKKIYGREVYNICRKSHLAVNGENVSLHGGYFMKLSDEDSVWILPVCGGG